MQTMTDELKQEQNQEKPEEQTVVAEETNEESGSNEESGMTDESATDVDVETQAEEKEQAVQEEEEAVQEEVTVASFTGDIDEDETYTYDQLQAASEDYSDEEFHQLAGMYENTLNEIEEKEIVTGRVVSADEDYVIVDIGFKSEGIVQTNEFPDEVVKNLAPGDEVDVFLDKVEDQEGQLILSRRKADILYAWETIERASETGE